MWHLAQMKQDIFFLQRPLKNHPKISFFPPFFYIFLLTFVWKRQKIWVLGFRRNLGCAPYSRSWVFFKIVKMQLFCCFITQLVKKLQQWSFYEVIEDILPFVFDTKRVLSDNWLLRYKKNRFGSFQKNSEFQSIQKKHPKLFCL